MNIDNYWFLLLAFGVGAAVSAALVLRWRRRHRTAHDLEHKMEIKAWENEGGNVAPTPRPPVLP